MDKACRNSWCASQNAYNPSVNMLLRIISVINHCLFRIVTIPCSECAADFCLGCLVYYHGRKINTRAKSTVFHRLRSWSQDFPCWYSRTQAKFCHRYLMYWDSEGFTTFSANPSSSQIHSQASPQKLQMNATHAKVSL